MKKFYNLLYNLNNKENYLPSIEDLKLLYEIDYNIFVSNLKYYRSGRNIYEDFCKIFGKDKVAKRIEEINEDTVAYIGDLFYEEKLPTYNLKYIYGNLYYFLDKIYNLENLEIVYGNILINTSYIVKTLDGIDNLRNIQIFRIQNLFEGIIDLSFIEKVEKISIWYLNYGENLILPEKLEELELVDEINTNNLILPESLKVFRLTKKEDLKGLTIPSGLNSLYVGTSLTKIEDIKDIKVLKR